MNVMSDPAAFNLRAISLFASARPSSLPFSIPSDKFLKRYLLSTAKIPFLFETAKKIRPYHIKRDFKKHQ